MARRSRNLFYIEQEGEGYTELHEIAGTTYEIVYSSLYAREKKYKQEYGLSGEQLFDDYYNEAKNRGQRLDELNGVTMLCRRYLNIINYSLILNL